LGWRPALNLEQSLGLIVDWCQARRAGQDMRQQTLAQIRSYQSITG